MCHLHRKPLSHLPSHPVPLGCPRALTLGALLHAWNLHWSSILHMVIHMSHAVLSNHPTLAFSHRVQKSVLYICIPFTALHIWSSLPSSKFHIYASIYCIGVSLLDLLHSVYYNQPLKLTLLYLRSWWKANHYKFLQHGRTQFVINIEYKP